MSEILNTVIGGLILAVIVYFLGLGGGSQSVTIVNGRRSTRKWKWLITISWVMILGGAYSGASGFPKGGFNNPLTGLGFCLVTLGIMLLCVGRFGHWMSRD